MVVGAGGMLVGGQGVAHVGQGRLLFRAWQFMQLMCDVMCAWAPCTACGWSFFLLLGLSIVAAAPMSCSITPQLPSTFPECKLSNFPLGGCKKWRSKNGLQIWERELGWFGDELL